MSNDEQATFHVGQEVWLSNWRMRREPRAVKVVKVARKYATVIWNGREEKFDRVTGRAPDDSGWYIETSAQRGERQAIKDAHDRLKAAGFRTAYDFPRFLNSDALNEIAAIAERSRSTAKEDA